MSVSYESTINVECYTDTQSITDVNQIIQICVVMEHSFLGDLDMFLTAPNGETVYFSQYGDLNDPGCNLGVLISLIMVTPEKDGNIVLAQHLLKIFQIAHQVLRCQRNIWSFKWLIIY